MHKLKKILIVAVILFCSLNASSVRGTSNSVKLVDLLEEAKGHDIEAALAEAEIAKLMRAVEDVEEKAEETNVLAGTPQTQLRSKVTKYIEPLRAEMNLEIAQRAENLRLVKREVAITEAYWQVYLAQIANEGAKIELEIANNNYEAAKIKLRNGSISGYELSAERYAHEQSQLNYLDLSNRHRKALFNLNELLEKDLTTRISAADSLTLKLPIDFSVDIDTVYETALSVSVEVYRLKKEAEFAAMKLQYAGEEFRPTSDEYLDVKAEKERADYKYLNSKNNLYRAVHSDANYLLMSLDNYKLLNLRLEMEQSNLLATEIKLAKGHVSDNDYLQSKANMLKAKYQLYSLITEINYEYQNFNVNYLLKN